jgi:hypothetical protein
LDGGTCQTGGGVGQWHLPDLGGRGGGQGGRWHLPDWGGGEVDGGTCQLLTLVSQALGNAFIVPMGASLAAWYFLKSDTPCLN